MKPSVFFAALLSCMIVRAQQSPVIQFDRTGMIRSSLPERLGKDDKVVFKVSDSQESFDAYLKTYKDRLKQAGSTLEKLKSDQDKMDILKKVFDISPTDIDSVVKQLNKLLADPIGSNDIHVPRFKATDKNYFNFAVTYTEKPAAEDVEPNTGTKEIPVKPFASDPRIKFALTQKDPFKKLTMNWLQGTKAEYGGTIDFGQLQQLQDNINKLVKEVEIFAVKARPEMVNLKTELAKKGGDQKALFNKYTPVLSETVSKSDSYIKQIDELVKKLAVAVNLHDKRSWMLKWLWYQKSSMPSLNPLGFVEAIGAAPDTSMLENLRAKIQVREAFLKANSDKLRTTQVDSILDVIDAFKKNIVQAQKAAKQFDERKASNEKAALAFRTTAKELNNGILFVEDNEGTHYWMRHHNAAVNFQLMNTLETDEFLETDRVVILAHNLKANEMAKLNLTLTEITNDASLLTEELIPVIASLEGALLGTGAGAATEFDKLAKKADDNLNKLIARLEKLKDNIPYLAYILQQTNPPLELEEETDKSVAYHSEVTNPVKKIKGPKKATYYLTTALVDKNSPDSATINKLPADTFSYRINKLYRIFPMAGITWSPNRFSNVNVDSAGNYSVDHESAVRFIVGVKVYLRKTDIRSSKFITEKDHTGKRVFLSRTSLNLAFDARKPLDNIYTGAGLDLWPGFCLNFGALFNKYTYKSYKNGSAYEVKKPYRAGFYMGLSTDLTLFAELGKFLNF